jgi:CheY-like chemotaxis protein
LSHPTNTPSEKAKPAPQSKGKVLIADDELSNRVILKSLLKNNGYEVIQAENGSQAVDLFEREQPDMVFMDVMMPIMDGYEAVTRIREQYPHRFVPIIFLTAMTEEDALVKCIEVGGDDFLTKPFSHAVLRSKIKAMERIRQLNQQVSRLFNRMQQDQELAERVFSGAVVADNVALDKIQTLIRPAELFSGDVLLTAYAPSRDLNVMLGDFTGHGLAAALGALPASEVFRAMTAKGFSTPQILAGINKKLKGLLPTGMFFAVQFITISHNLDYITVCNCGMPDVLVLHGKTGLIKHRAPSRGLPLGITVAAEFQDIVEPVAIEAGDRVVLVSDGVTEARSPEREYYGRERFEDAIQEKAAGETALDSVSRSLEGFCQDAPQDDDISLAEIPCLPELLPGLSTLIRKTKHIVPGEEIPAGDTIDFNLTLRGNRLREADPVPLIINHIQELEGLGDHRRLLFTILTELYVNALDHGVLGLDSKLKSPAEGFTEYFSKREQKLEQLSEGYVRISIQTIPLTKGGQMLIQMEDSGSGFDFGNYDASKVSESQLSGRGIRLISELCESLTYQEPGNKVEALYSWSND